MYVGSYVSWFCYSFHGANYFSVCNNYSYISGIAVNKLLYYVRLLEAFQSINNCLCTCLGVSKHYALAVSSGRSLYYCWIFNVIKNLFSPLYCCRNVGFWYWYVIFLQVQQC